MAAPKLHNLFKKEQGVPEKARLEQLIKKLQDQLKDPSTAKKAALIIERLIRQK